MSSIFSVFSNNQPATTTTVFDISNNEFIKSISGLPTWSKTLLVWVAIHYLITNHLRPAFYLVLSGTITYCVFHPEFIHTISPFVSNLLNTLRGFF